MAYEQALINIFPDFSQFNSRLRADLTAAMARVGPAKIKARVEASQVSRAISEATRRADTMVTLTARINDVEFKRHLAELEHGPNSRITLQARLDSAKARLEKAELGKDQTVIFRAKAEVKAAKATLREAARSAGERTRQESLGEEHAHEIDRREAQPRLVTLQQRVRDTGSDVATRRSRIDVNDRGALLEIEAIENRLHRLAREVAHPRISLDGVARAEAEIIMLQHRLHSLGRAGPSGDNDSGMLGGATQSRGARALTLAIISLGATAAPILASLVVGIAALSTSLAAAGGVLGVFAIAAVGQFRSIQKAMEWTTQTKKWQPMVPPDYVQAITAFQQLRATWKAFEAATRAPVLAVFTQVLDYVNSLLPRFIPLVYAAADGIKASLDVIKGFTSSSEFSQFMAFFRDEGPNAMVSLTKSIMNVVGAIGNLFIAFTPVSRDLLSGIEAVTRKFRDWTASLAGSQKFQQFVEYVKEAGPKLWATIVDIVQGLWHIGVALAPLGGAIIAIIDGFAKFVSAVPTKVLTGLAVAIVYVTVAYKAMQVAAMATKALAQVTTPIVNGWKAVSTSVAATVTQMRAAGSVGAASMVALRAAASGAAIAVRGLVVAIKAIASATIVMLVITAITTALVWAWEKLTAAKKKDTDATKANAQAGIELINVYRDQGKALGDLALAERVRSDPDFGNRIAQYLALGGSIDIYKEALNGSKWAQDQIEKSFNTAIVQTQDHKKAVEDLTDSFIKGKISKEEYNKGMLALTGKTESNAGYIKDAKAATEADDKHVKSLQDNRDAQIKAFQTGQKTAEVLRLIGVNSGNASKDINDLAQAFSRYQAAQQGSPHQQIAFDLVGKYRSLIDAQNSARDSKEALTIAIEQESQANVQAGLRVRDAERTLTDAHDKVRLAQEKLTQARVDAIKKLRDQKDAEEGASISQERARLALMKTNMDPSATWLDRREAVLAYKNAQDDVNDTTAEGEKLRRQGIDGQPEVISANKEVRDSIANEATAERDLQQAHIDQTRAARDGAHATRNAREAVEKATIAQQDATIAFNNASAAADHEGVSIDLLTGKGRELAKTWTMKIELDKGNVDKELHDTLVMMKATGWLKLHPEWSIKQAWDAAEKEVTSAEKTATATVWANYRGPSPNTYNVNVPGPTPAAGGPIFGPGSGTSDSIPALGPIAGARYWLSNNEHIWTAAEVRAAGGHAAVARLRKAALASTKLRTAVNFAEKRRLDANRQTMFSSGGAVLAGSQGSNASSNNITVNQTINNPLPERASVSGPKSLRRAANQLGR